MDEVWNDAVLERLNLTVRIYKGELTAADGERIVSELKEVSKRWVSRSAEACQEYNRNTDISTADYDRQETCFDSALNMLKKRLIRFSDGDNTALDDISTITDKCL